VIFKLSGIGPLNQRLRAPGEHLKGDPPLRVTLLHGGDETRLVGNLCTGGVNGEVIGEMGIMFVQRGVQGRERAAASSG
jgi:hypothetical protein